MVLRSAMERRTYGAAAILAMLALAIAFRLYLLAATDFPINDGALFLEFVRGIEATFPALPAEIAYNGMQIPFAYPPLSFWLAAALARLGFHPLEILHVAPLLINIGYVFLFAVLLRRLGHSTVLTALALFLFCTNLRSFEWLIMGGGLARGLAAFLMLVALVALTWGVRGDGRRNKGALIVAGVAVAGAVLSHPQWGVIAAAFAVALIATRSASMKQFIASSLIVGLAATALVLPWVIQIVSVHGVQPFLAAAATSQHDQLATAVIDLVRAVAINPFIAIGAAAFLLRKDSFWLAALILSAIVTPRLAAQAWALPIAVLAGQGVLTAVVIARRIATRRGVAEAAVALAVLVIIGWRVERDVRLSGEVYRPLKPGLRQAMQWVAANQAGRSFAVLSKAPWYYDSSAEWFPVLAKARSVTTAQGREWLPDRQFEHWIEWSKAQKDDDRCSNLKARLRPFGLFDYVWAETHRACFDAANIAPIFSNRDVAIYRAPPGFSRTAAAR